MEKLVSGDERTRLAGSEEGRVRPGTVLNDAWEVIRLHAQGGMGEIYEGRNVATDERVAIKVLHERFALDPRGRGVLLSEARKMTRIRHDAVVHYIMMGQAPDLGLSYIVMDYIEGPSLSGLIGVIHPGLDEMRSLMRRLAEGLRAAHASEVFHRDFSPDNVLLPGGRLEAAKIIDFGIAKDASGQLSTIVGDAFAGKIGFAAPEQFGEYEGKIGPWTDVYSLGLVMLSLAQGEVVNMGSTLVEAIERRRKGPDLAAAPPALKGLFEVMLAADPKHRFRSMDALIVALEASQTPKVATPAPKPAPPIAPPQPTPAPAAPRRSRWPTYLAAAAICVIGLVIISSMFAPRPTATPAPAQSPPAQTSSGDAAPPAARAQGPVAIELSPAQPWADSGFFAQSGETVAVLATGSVYIGSIGASATPVGYPQYAGLNQSTGFVAPGLSPWSLVGRIGPAGAPFEIGAGGSFTVTQTGELYLSVNDNSFTNNNGAWKVAIARTGGGTSGAQTNPSDDPNE